ncbi:MAG TPA: PQQ-binding-like beta-propeller repeat protein [Vicinamibacterales bacterium]|jgi:outer membrane protein assembly factor BamB|nr:PQQ-binding-like beta-propeller repeat protein [Vicinamibacterales bacterium]
MRATIATVAVLVALATGLAVMQGTPGWYQWRGPNRDGHSAETGLLKEWPSQGPPRVWSTTGAGIGYSSFSASGGRLYTLGVRGKTEFVIAFDEATGKRLWETSNGQRFDNEQGDGPRSTPTVDGDQIYALGASGDLSCLDATTGKVVWTRNLLREFGGDNAPYGISESPLVTGDRVLVNAGGPKASVVALNKATGATLWRSQGDEAGYSSAVLAQVGGSQQAIFFTARRALGVDVRDGKLLWSYPRVSNTTANIATPVVNGTRVFLSSDYGTGAALLELSPSGAREVYFTREMRNHHSSSVLVGDYLYGFSSSILTAMRFSDGSVAWRDRSVGKGSVIYADQRLYLFSENGVVGLAEASPTAYREHGRFRIEAKSGPTWTHPIITGGKLILRDQDNVYAYDVRQR